MQRREFIAGGIGVLAWAGIGTAAHAAGRAEMALDAQGFAALINEQFNIFDSVRGITVRLVKVKPGPAAAGLQQFSLNFEGERAGALPSGTYEVEHALTGKTVLYLDASAHGQHVTRYRADFSLLR